MITFKQYYLLEDDGSPEVKAKLKHLEHIEELIVNEGPQGAQRAINFISRLIAVVSGSKDTNLAVNVKQTKQHMICIALRLNVTMLVKRTWSLLKIFRTLRKVLLNVKQRMSKRGN